MKTAEELINTELIKKVINTELTEGRPVHLVKN
jgi:hypothetical protein